MGNTVKSYWKMEPSKLPITLGNIMRIFVTCSLWRGGRGHLSTSRLVNGWHCTAGFLSWGHLSWKVIFSQELIKYEGIIMTPTCHNLLFKEASRGRGRGGCAWLLGKTLAGHIFIRQQGTGMASVIVLQVGTSMWDLGTHHTLLGVHLDPLSWKP